MKSITIFTPTYNRKNTLKRLYESLCMQTCQEFKWLIVDDGSTDDTHDFINQCRKENLIEINYIYQKNAGKSMAHNKGVEKCDTELFSCVDSDDYLVPNAIEIILNNWKKVHENCIGILAFRSYENKPLTTLKKKVIYATLIELYRKYGLRGDTMLIYKTKYIAKYKFPKFDGEKFVPEAYLYDKLDQNGKLFVLKKAIYIGEYLDSGYTNNMNDLIKRNPNGYICYIKQRISLNKNVLYKYLDTIRYIAITKTLRNYRVFNKNNFIYNIFAYPFGILLYLNKYKFKS